MISSRLQKNVDEAFSYLVNKSGLKPENVAAIVCHVGNPKHREALIDLALKRFGRIDILASYSGDTV